MIAKESIDKLIQISDIVEVIGHYLDVKKSGANFQAICPFHNDTHPSLMISPTKQIYHCFVCEAGGGAINFIMEYEKVGFVEAVQILAKMYNFELSYTSDDFADKEKKDDKKILEMLNAYYQSLLYSNKKAIDYLYSRGLDDKTIQNFGLGWAPGSANTIRALENEQIEPGEALAVGAIKQNENGFYASFIDRITFPIFDERSRIVGFGGRTLNSENKAKYVNSPDSSVFNKSKIFYAYDLARKDAVKKNELIICEGYMDVIMLHKAGITNAVAVLGTALTEQHLPILKRMKFHIILSFDGDTAGIRAAVRSAELLLKNEINTSVVIIENGADPADMVFAGKIDELREIYSKGVEGGEFLIRQIASNFDLSKPILRKEALSEIQKLTFSLDYIVAMGYENLVSAVLNLPIGSFSLTNKKNNLSSNPKMPLMPKAHKKDIAELEILKTMISDENFKLLGLDELKSKNFRAHADIFEILKSGVKWQENPILRELMIDDSIKESNNLRSFSKAISILKINFCKNELLRLARSDEKDKFIKMEQIRQEIKELS